jgi:hypothetical protein
MKVFVPILLIGLAALSGCASGTAITFDYIVGTDFTRYRTFAMLQQPGSFPNVPAGPTFLARLQLAGTTTLTARGYAVADESGADFLVLVHGHLTPQVNIENLGYILPGQPWWRGGYYGPGWSSGHLGRRMTITNEGHLVLDVIDRRTKALVWRGFARRDDVPDQPDPERLAIVVGKILANFPPPAPAPNQP